jgi:signal transduction histidine kinase
MTPRLYTATFIAALLWFVTPALLALAGIDPVIIRSSDVLALAWYALLCGLGALACARTGYGSRRARRVWLLWLFVAVFFPALVRYPLITIRAAHELALLWFIVAWVGTGILIVWAGKAVRQYDDAHTQVVKLLSVVDSATGNGLALYDGNMRMRWSNRAAQQYLNGETERLARYALETGHMASQSYSLNETTRLNVQAVPLEGKLIAVTAAPLRHETDQFYERFIRRIVHDMRNPLAAIIAHASNLRDASSVDQNSLATIEHEAQRLARLVDSILFDARLSYVPLAIEPVDLIDVLEEVQYQHDERAIREGKSLQIEAFTDTALIEADRDLLVRALGNLVDNSLKYSQAGAKISIMLASGQGQYVVKVSDTGDGIPPDYLPDRIFEALVRARPKDGGSGLGLSIVKKIVEMHKGSIAVESTLGKGTTFTLCLPKSPFSP